ncbi:MAG: decarboxylase [Desulfurococcaceae archaeon]
MSSEWTIDIARKVYGLENYARRDIIDVDEEGFLVIKLNEEKLRVKNLMDKYNLDIAYIRILPAIKKSMDTVYESYRAVAEVIGYDKNPILVYPMKVNPTPIVVETIAKHGEKYQWGFNTGSLGEVKLLQKIAEKYSPRVLIYDGVVSEQAVQELLKLLSKGWRVFVDVESENEAEILSKYPQLEIGIRVKPMVKMHGKWSGSVGLGSKFGLTLNALTRLKQEFRWLTERTTLLHMHPGSQVYKYEDVKNYLNEVRFVYEELRNMGFESISVVDPGGGMAYPYLDVRNGSEESPNYTIVDYFKALLETFTRSQVKPHLVYEGGRFIVASHRLVVAKVVDVRSYSAVHSLREHYEQVSEVHSLEDVKALLSKLEITLNELRLNITSNNNNREMYEDIVALIREDLAAKIAELVSTGKVEVRELVCDHKILRIMITPTKRFILNMSIFADIPDVVLVDQYFQVVPAQRLHEKPNVLASLSDLTCDSMGEITEYISPGNTIKGLSPVFTLLDSKLIAVPGIKLRLRGVPLHLPVRGESYYLVFLDTGAYQDTLAMKHNLIYGAPEIIIDQVNGEVKINFLKHEDLYT